MKEVIKFLVANPLGCLATVDNNAPRVRPWGFMLEEDGKLWFCTANNKDVFRQLQKNPVVEFCSTSKEMVTVIISGEVRFNRDLTMKGKIMERNDLVKSIYQTPGNPVFEIFYLEHGKVVIADFSGQPPRTLKF